MRNPSPAPTPSAAVPLGRRLWDLLRWVAAGESPPPAPHPGPLGWLFAPEPVPRNPGTGPGGPGHPGFLAWLFAPESIPRSLETGSGGEGHPAFLAWLFHPESLPGTPTAGPEPTEDIDGSS